MSKENECQFYSTTEKLARKKGLAMPQRCPYIPTCSAESCPTPSPSVPTSEPEEFKSKLVDQFRKFRTSIGKVGGE